MLTPYPLKPVITNDKRLAALYDNHPESIDMISACLTPEEANRLLDQGAVFDSVVVLNGDGEQLIQRLVPMTEDYDEALFPQVVSVTLDHIDGQSVPVIHSALGKRRARGFFAAGG
ncbi:MAG TPA: hypothetical protein VF427_10820 [Noviherbaspirillum sp.]